ncbi:flagellar basal body L-ring protein FlgH [Microbulbifer thermotolerans]|uniref:flagellar basal body L-ring protein FlgH n=1 Tax=Microbulbifer thermotolerans TaxID=252514 RepID=UPI0022491AE7|nr:flagellar basal body L-ring protein FlgH [Microbulbifer thermotolerans]MCX2780107.1 flagellar basal body L-ring protein FlgH [Microbulbifer thermotolerans]MCX2795880.1 flagellar basal body L-ring protein FlgH [Microbulbifer thermotolerans]MCX2805531.1 flagellar basal body L-ring protein FlgH [Microbulbifer thermotolerans]MCX2831942.1 flagellar basal body L-ring protein FlgH [Microbulbifer thermotolerans]MCX2842493.1 flagellar basal body L-ring protein FlgH [Microbulbifer thermotolerans]
MLSVVKKITVAALIMLNAGCAYLPRSSVVSQEEWVSVPVPPPAKPNGAIYQADRGYRPLFEDRRPRMAGDLLTVVFNEQVSASKSAESNASRSGTGSLTSTVVPDGLESLTDYGFDIEGSNDFEGGGGASAENTFTGTMAVTVLEVLPNGNLRVRGEKQIVINQGTEYIRFSGIIDPREISSANTVLSTQVAEARIEYVGDGYIDEAQHMGWLQRLFLNLSPF